MRSVFGGPITCAIFCLVYSGYVGASCINTCAHRRNESRPNYRWAKNRASGGAPIDGSQIDALRAIFASTGGSKWQEGASDWTKPVCKLLQNCVAVLSFSCARRQDSECGWFGVTCDDSHSVTEIRCGSYGPPVIAVRVLSMWVQLEPQWPRRKPAGEAPAQLLTGAA